MSALFENTLKLRGFLGSDAEVPTSDRISNDAFAVLTLCIESGTWRKAANEWHPWTAWYRVICPGPFFCGYTRGMKQGDYVEIEGQLHISHYDQPVVVAGKTITDKRPSYEIHASQIRRLDCPTVGVNDDEDG